MLRVEREAHNMPPRELTYFTTGAACVLVEVDCATGEHKVKGDANDSFRTDRSVYITAQVGRYHYGPRRQHQSGN